MKPIHKYNNGRGATLCHKCHIIISEGLTDDLYCKTCDFTAPTILLFRGVTRRLDETMPESFTNLRPTKEIEMHQIMGFIFKQLRGSFKEYIGKRNNPDMMRLLKRETIKLLMPPPHQVNTRSMLDFDCAKGDTDDEIVMVPKNFYTALCLELAKYGKIPHPASVGGKNTFITGVKC